MNTLNGTSRFWGRGIAAVLTLAALSTGALAQDTTTKTVKAGESSYETKVRNSEVVYVEGNNLVLRLENGKIEHLVVPDIDIFTIDGKGVTVHDLTPGTKLTQTITTDTAPHYVTTVRTIKGKIWHASPPNSVILTVPGSGNQVFQIPSGAKITVEGQPKTVFDLRKGMTIEATIVTDETHTVMQQSKAIAGQAPPPATPREVGLLLFLQPTLRPIQAPVMTASTEEPVPATLPKTGSLLPLAGMLGALAIAMSAGLGVVRRAFVQA